MKIRLDLPSLASEHGDAFEPRGSGDCPSLDEDQQLTLGDSPRLLRAVSTRLKLAAAAHGAVPACACPEVLPGAQADDLTQLRHIVLECAMALEHLHSLWVDAGHDKRIGPPTQRRHTRSAMPFGGEPQLATAHLHLQDTLTGPSHRRLP